jgi:hypothetical protein
MTALPAKGLRFGPGFEYQLHRLGGALPRLRRVEVEGQDFVCGPAQHPKNEASIRQGVEHRHLLGNLHRVALRDNRAQDRDLYFLRLSGNVRPGNRDIGSQDSWRVMVLGQADPVETQLLDMAHPVDHALIGFGTGFGIISPGRYRPLRRNRRRHLVTRSFKI